MPDADVAFKPIVEHLNTLTGFPAFTIVVDDLLEDGDEPAWRLDNGKPGFLRWRIYEVGGKIGESLDQIGYARKGSMSNIPEVTDYELSEPLAHGTVKWDGCCNWEAEGGGAMMHSCDAEALSLFCRALQRAYALAAEGTVDA